MIDRALDSRRELSALQASEASSKVIHLGSKLIIDALVNSYQADMFVPSLLPWMYRRHFIRARDGEGRDAEVDR